MIDKKEIDEEVKKLKEMKPKVRHNNFFGDDNHAAIDAQIEVLENDLDQDDIDGKFDDGDWDDHERSNAEEALNWKEEESEDGSPSSQWEELIVK